MIPFLLPWNGNNMVIPTFPEDIIAAGGSAYPPHFPFQAPPFSSQDFMMDTQMLPFRPPWNANNMVVPIFPEDTIAAEGSACPPYLQNPGPPFPSQNQHPTPAAIAPFQVPKIPSKFDWEKHRAEITRLYRDEKWTLNDVMKFMRERYDFRATTKMFKTRISYWDIRRNLRRSEREDACRELQQRWLAGEEVSAVVVRGQEKNVAVLLRHMRNARRGGYNRSIARNQTWQIRTDIASPASPLYPAGDERPVEVICIQTVYVCQAFPIDISSAEDDSYRNMMRAMERASDSQYREARVLLNKVAQWFQNKIRYEAGSVLLCILRNLSLRSYTPTQRFDPLDLFHNHALSLSKIVHGPRHPLTIILTQLLSVQDCVMASLSAIQAAIQAMQGSSGGFLDDTYWLRNVFTGILEESGDHERAGQLYLDALEELRRLTPQYPYAMINATSSLAWHYFEFEPDKYKKAKKLFKSIQAFGSVSDTETADYAAHSSCYGLAFLAQYNGNLGKAEHCFRAAADAAVKCWGEGGSVSVAARENLARVLDLQGKHVEAEVVRKQCEILDDEDALEEMEEAM
jgi:hypothetical protein